MKRFSAFVRPFVALALCASLLLGFPACGDQSQPVSTPVDEPDTKPGYLSTAEEPVTLSWYVNFSWFTTSWNDSLVARTITEETGVSINFITPVGNEWEKLGSMMTGDTLPDLITLGHWEPQLAEMITEEMVYPLNELADRYDPYFWQVAHPERVSWYTQEDGNLYGYPNSSYGPADYARYGTIGSNQAFLVRADLYEALGRPDMTTPEGFMQAIRDVSVLYPEMGGEGLLPVGLYGFDKDGCFSLEDILMNLLAIPHEEDGQLVDRHTNPDYIAWLKVFRQLTDEGYLPYETFVARQTQVAEKVAEGRYFCMFYQHTDIADQQKYRYNQDPESVYIAVDGPKNAAGDDHVLPGVGINGWTVTLISKNCKAPDRAIQLMSYMMSEPGQMLLYCGVEGETYDMVDGSPVFYDDVLELLATDRIEYNRLYGADNTYWMLQDLAMQQDWRPEPAPPLAQPEQWTYPYTVYSAQYETNLGANPAALDANQQIREAWGETLPRLLLAESEEAFDKILEEYLALRETLGYHLVMEENERQVSRAKARLGLE